MEVFHGAGSVPSTNSVARDVVPAVELVDVQAQGPTEDLGKGGPRQGLEALGAQVGGRAQVIEDAAAASRFLILRISGPC